MKSAFRSVLRLVVGLCLCLWVVGTASAEVSVRAGKFLKKMEQEAPELFFIPLAGVDAGDPHKATKRRMEWSDDWLEVVSRLVNDREIDFRFMPFKLENVAEAKGYPRAHCWRRGEECGIVLRRFQDAKSQWITPWDSGENWMMVVFELMNLEGLPAVERSFNTAGEMIESVARREYRAMQRTNDVFYRSWVPYCEKMGARVEMSRIPWFNRNVAMTEEEWVKQVATSAEFQEYREWIKTGFEHRLRKADAAPDAEVVVPKGVEVEVE